MKLAEKVIALHEENSKVSIKKLDKLLKGFDKYQTNSFDDTGFAWIKDGKIVTTMHYPKNDINVTIGKFTGNTKEMEDYDKGVDWYIKLNTSGKKVLKQFDKSDTYDGVDKYKFVKKLLSDIK